MKGKKILKFITTNNNKYSEYKTILGLNAPNIEVEKLSIDVPELQGEPENIAKEKLIYALKKEKGPLIIEDTSLCFNGLCGLPGPYIKDFLKLKPEGLYKLIENNNDKTAYAQCIIGLGFNNNYKLFIGRTNGSIVVPRGIEKFGWDSVFQPDGFDKTYAELNKDVKNSISHRYKAIALMIEYLQENENIFSE